MHLENQIPKRSGITMQSQLYTNRRISNTMTIKLDKKKEKLTELIPKINNLKDTKQYLTEVKGVEALIKNL